MFSFKKRKYEASTLPELVAGAPRAKRGPVDSLNMEAPYKLIQRYKPHVLVFHLITQQHKHNKTFR